MLLRNIANLKKQTANILIYGLAGGSLMTAVAVIHSAYEGHNPVAPLYGVAETVFGATAYQGGPVVLVTGILLHAVFSIGAAAAFFFAARRVKSTSFNIVLGLLYGFAIYLAMTYVFLPISNPIMASSVIKMNAIWILKHLIFGLTIALGNTREVTQSSKNGAVNGRFTRVVADL